MPSMMHSTKLSSKCIPLQRKGSRQRKRNIMISMLARVFCFTPCLVLLHHLKSDLILQ